jgi:hypothetical protein
VTRPDLILPLAELARQQAHSDPEMPKRLAQAVKREVLLATLQENLLAEAMRLLSDAVRPEQANWRLPVDLDLRQTEQRSVRAVGRRLPAGRPRLQDLRLRRAERFPVPPARARRYSKDPGPYAFFREILAAQKYNRAVRYGGRPISAQYRPPRNRRALVGCDNRCSRSRRKHARRAQPFPIAAGDKHRCHPPPFAD